MPSVVARAVRCGRDRAAGVLGEEVDRRAASDQLEPAFEAATDCQAESLAVEGGRLVEVVDVDVDQQVHAVTLTGGAWRMVCITTQ